MENQEILQNIAAFVSVAIFIYGLKSAVTDTYNRFKKKGNKNKEMWRSMKDVRVPKYNQPAAFDYTARQRESDLLHTATIIYANDSLGALDIDTAVEKADLLIKSVGALLKKERDLQAFKLGISDPWVD